MPALKPEFNLEEYLTKKFYEYRELIEQSTDSDLTWHYSGKLLAINDVIEAAGFVVPS